MQRRRLQFDYLVERAVKKIGGWMSKSFSTGGKEVLIKSVIQSIPTYTMTCFRVPVSICNNIERSCARFWWGDKEKEKHMHWLTWKAMCKPKSRGGMGFKSLVEFNQALLAKQIWRLIRYPDSFVAKIMKAKYFPDCDIMDAKISSNCSFIWRSLIWGRELLRKGLLWKIGNGKSVRIFEDPWLPNLPSGRLIRQPLENEEARVAELFDDNGCWDRGKLDEKFLQVEVEEILHTGRSSHLVSDMRYWKYDPKGEYSVKSGYLVASKFFEHTVSYSEDSNIQWWKYLWSFNLPQRVRIFAWRVFRNIIPTEINLHKHHVPVFGRCGWCRKGWGTTAHVLIYCDKIRQNWMNFKFWSVLKKWEGTEIWEIGGAMQSGVSREEFEQWLMGLWLIWKRLCAEKYKDHRCSWSDLKNECESYISTYSAACQQAATQARVIPEVGDLNWKCPKRGRFRLDVDYAVDERNGRGGVGAIVRDDAANIICAMAKPVSISTTVLHGELKALMHGICMCIEDGLSPVEAFSDSLLAVMTVAEEKEEASVLCEDFFDFFAMVKKLNVISVSHVCREANMAAHELAILARSLDTTLMWHDNWPSWLLRIVKDDSK